MATKFETFLAGMTYAAGPRRAMEILSDEKSRSDIELVIEALPELALTAEELLREHRGW